MVGPVERPSAPARVRLPRDERRALLLEAAMAVFAEHGYHATAMDDIAERAGVSKPVLYQHFDSKLDLYLALTERVRDEVLESLGGALASTTDNGRRLAAALEAFFGFVDRPGSGYRLLASDLRGEPAVAAVVEQAQHACAEAIGRVVQEETALGWEESTLVGVGITAEVQAVARHWYEHSPPLTRQEAVDLLTTLVWRGIAHVPQSDVAAIARPPGAVPGPGDDAG